MRDAWRRCRPRASAHATSPAYPSPALAAAGQALPAHIQALIEVGLRAPRDGPPRKAQQDLEAGPLLSRLCLLGANLALACGRAIGGEEEIESSGRWAWGTCHTCNAAASAQRLPKRQACRRLPGCTANWLQSLPLRSCRAAMRRATAVSAGARSSTRAPGTFAWCLQMGEQTLCRIRQVINASAHEGPPPAHAAHPSPFKPAGQPKPAGSWRRPAHRHRYPSSSSTRLDTSCGTVGPSCGGARPAGGAAGGEVGSWQLEVGSWRPNPTAAEAGCACPHLWFARQQPCAFMPADLRFQSSTHQGQ